MKTTDGSFICVLKDTSHIVRDYFFTSREELDEQLAGILTNRRFLIDRLYVVYGDGDLEVYDGAAARERFKLQ